MILLMCNEVNAKRYKVNDVIENQFVMNKKFQLNLPKGKWMCLNIPDLMYDKIKVKWKKCTKKDDYMIISF